MKLWVVGVGGDNGRRWYYFRRATYIFIMTQLDMRSTLPTGKQRTADELTLNSVVDPSYCIL